MLIDNFVEAIMKLNQLKLLVNDVEKSFEFYRQALKLEVIHAPEDQQAQLRAGEAILTLLAAHKFEADLGVKGQTACPGGFVLQFQVPDVQASYAAALSAGAQHFKSPRRTPWRTLSAFLRDPDGVLVEIYRPLTPTEELRARPERQA
jgi:lactoylglutathione lyase